MKTGSSTGPKKESFSMDSLSRVSPVVEIYRVNKRCIARILRDFGDSDGNVNIGRTLRLTLQIYSILPPILTAIVSRNSNYTESFSRLVCTTDER